MSHNHIWYIIHHQGQHTFRFRIISFKLSYISNNIKFVTISTCFSFVHYSDMLQLWEMFLGCFQSWDVIRGYFAHQSMLRPPSSSSLPPGAGGPPHLTGRGILLSNRLCKENFRSQVIFTGTIQSDAFIGWPCKCTETIFFSRKSATQGSMLCYISTIINENGFSWR